MKYLNNIVIALIGVLLFTTCGLEASKEIVHLNSLFRERGIEFDTGLDYCVIIPEVGCEGCIAGGVGFIQNHKDIFSNVQSNNIVVFTSINSKKLLYRNLGFDNPKDIEVLNYVIDDDNKYRIDSPMSKYPVLLRLKEGRIVEVEYQTPDNP